MMGGEYGKSFCYGENWSNRISGFNKDSEGKGCQNVGVLNVHAVFGEYDLIVEVEAKDLGELSRLVDDRIRAISGVESTVTFICYDPL